MAFCNAACRHQARRSFNKNLNRVFAPSHHAAICCRASFVDTSVLVLGDGEPVPGKPGIYAVFNSENTLQYIGISRNMNLSVDTHVKALGKERAHAVKVQVVETATKDQLVAGWKAWLQEAVEATGHVPPGNKEEKELWQGKPQVKALPELRLTAGKGPSDLSVSMQELIKMVVDNEPIVAFIKGTRTQPQCGFSHQLLLTLNSINIKYQVVNVLDEVYNPGLRDAIKEFSQWPTIPQLYVGAEFYGGCDIVLEANQKGILKEDLQRVIEYRKSV